MLFEAHLNDGTIIRQTSEDKSAHTEGKNAYFDVLQRAEEVSFFGLFDADRTCLVDLRDGHFELNGIPFKAQDPRVTPGGTPLRLIYFKRIKTDFVGTVLVGDHTVYHIGYQFTVDGKNYQQTIAVS